MRSRASVRLRKAATTIPMPCKGIRRAPHEHLRGCAIRALRGASGSSSRPEWLPPGSVTISDTFLTLFVLQGTESARWSCSSSLGSENPRDSKAGLARTRIITCRSIGTPPAARVAMSAFPSRRPLRVQQSGLNDAGPVASTGSSVLRRSAAFPEGRSMGALSWLSSLDRREGLGRWSARRGYRTSDHTC